MIEYGNSICRLKTTDEIDSMLADSPLHVMETIDLTVADLGNDVPWYSTLQSGMVLVSDQAHQAQQNSSWSHAAYVRNSQNIAKRNQAIHKNCCSLQRMV